MTTNITKHPHKTKTHYTRKRTEKLLKDLKMYEYYAEYYKTLADEGKIPLRQLSTVKLRAENCAETVNRIKTAVTLLPQTERIIITTLFMQDNTTVDDACEAAHLERSSVYKYKASALDKLSLALFGR